MNFLVLILAGMLSSFTLAALSDTCNQDDVLSCFISDPTATPFCSSYISVPLITQTVAIPTTLIPVITTTSGLSISTTSITTLPQDKGDFTVIPLVQPTPTCLSQNEQATDISSACSCLDIVPATTTVMFTASVPMSTWTGLSNGPNGTDGNGTVAGPPHRLDPSGRRPWPSRGAHRALMV